MSNIKIYSAEKDIEQLIVQNTSISHLVEAKCTESISQELLDKITKSTASNLSERSNFDLFPLKSLLVSSVLNGNDDYFLPVELWLARNTAKDKPFNHEHEESDIIGHMVNSYVVDENGKKLEETTKLEDLPNTLHIISDAVLYKHWSDKAKQDRMDKIIAEIKEGQWYVSVECLFPDFDYLLHSDDGSMKLVARNEKTAFLTKYLRIYNGVGVYNNQKIARVPRNFIISGKGLVRRPANELSEIFAKKFDISKNSITNNLEMVYEILEVNKMNEQEFKTTLAKLESQLTQFQTENSQLKASLNQGELQKVQAQLETVTKAAEASVQELNTLKANLEKTNSEKVELAKVYDEILKQKKGLEDQLNKISAEKSLSDRINLCKNSMNMEQKDAEAYVAGLSLLTDEAFKSHVEFNAKFTQVKAGQTTVVETVVPEKNALQKTETTPAPSLTVPSANSGNEEVQKLGAALNAYIEQGNFIKKGKAKFALTDKK